MPSTTWKLLESIVHGLVQEAKTTEDYKDAIIRKVTARYGEHATDELQALFHRYKGQDLVHQVSMAYDWPEVDALAKKMVGIHEPEPEKRGPGRPPGKKTDPRDDDDRFWNSSNQDKGSGPSEPIPARPDRAGTTTNVPQRKPVSIKPGEKPRSDVGHAGQYKTNVQPSVAAGVVPNEPAVQSRDDRGPGRPRSTKSGIVMAQRHVDDVTKSKGTEAGASLAKRLGVPTSAQRWNQDTKRPNTWSPDRVMKFMDADVNPDAPRTNPVSRRHANADAQKAAIDAPDRTDMIRQGILKRRALGPVHTPKFDGSYNGQTWTPAGRSKEIGTARPDPATGRMVRGKAETNPSHAGQSVKWDARSSEWVLPSVWHARQAQEIGASEPEDDDLAALGGFSPPHDEK